MSAPAFELHPDLDVPALCRAFAQNRRIAIAPFLREADAERLLDHLQSREDWRMVLNSGDKVFELDRGAQASLSPERAERLQQAVHEAARDGFQYSYESVRVPDGAQARADNDTPLDAFAEFMSDGPARMLLREVTGFSDIDFADAQATCYRRGDFLTAHDDAVDGKRRRAAYVMGLTHRWRAEWGGLLLFHGKAGRIDDGFVPAFNSLSLFAVPQDHSVSLVAPFAPFHRYSITGWLRSARR